MMKTTLAAAALLLSLVPASADQRYTWRSSNGYSVTSNCHRSFYNGTTCTTSSSGDILGRQAPQEPVEFIPNKDADWGKGCRSCADLSKPQGEGK